MRANCFDMSKPRSKIWKSSFCDRLTFQLFCPEIHSQQTDFPRFRQENLVTIYVYTVYRPWYLTVLPGLYVAQSVWLPRHFQDPFDASMLLF